jgi:hypothetical protein
MAGVTPHGIRYPDGASKAKNLGPELKLMAEDIDGVITDLDGPLRPIIDDIADDAVDEHLASKNVVQAYPEGEVAQTGLAGVPMEWQYKTLKSIYPRVYPRVYPGTWVNGGKRRGDLAVLRRDGTLNPSTIPADFPMTCPTP